MTGRPLLLCVIGIVTVAGAFVASDFVVARSRDQPDRSVFAAAARCYFRHTSWPPPFAQPLEIRIGRETNPVALALNRRWDLALRTGVGTAADEKAIRGISLPYADPLELRWLGPDLVIARNGVVGTGPAALVDFVVVFTRAHGVWKLEQFYQVHRRRLMGGGVMVSPAPTRGESGQR